VATNKTFHQEETKKIKDRRKEALVFRFNEQTPERIKNEEEWGAVEQKRSLPKKEGKRGMDRGSKLLAGGHVKNETTHTNGASERLREQKKGREPMVREVGESWKQAYGGD